MTHITSAQLAPRLVAARAPASSGGRSRVGLATILTAAVLAIGVGIGLAFGPLGVVLFLLPVPAPVALLWLSADVLRADEQNNAGT